jgi:hypothetical protein
VPSREKPRQRPLRCGTVHFLQSGLWTRYREIRACFAYFEVSGGGISLQFRLRGGGRGIRTLSTGLNGVRSRRLRKLRGINEFRILRETACSPFDTLTVRFREASRGEALATVWLKVVTFRVTQSARSGLDATACLAGSHEIEILSSRTLRFGRDGLVLNQFVDRTLQNPNRPTDFDEVQVFSSKYQRSRLGESASPTTVNLEVGTIRSILRRNKIWAYIQPDVRMLPTPSDIGRALSPEEERALLKACLESRSRVSILR